MNTLELKKYNQVIKVPFVALQLYFHAKFWGKHKNILCIGLWWFLSIENEYTLFSLPRSIWECHNSIFLFLVSTSCVSAIPTNTPGADSEIEEGGGIHIKWGLVQRA